MYRMLILILLSTNIPSLFAQNLSDSNALRSANNEFENLVKEFKQEEYVTDKGYRIQIFNGNYKDAETRRSECIKAFSEFKAYLSYDAPEYLVQVGDFSDYFNAQAKALELRKVFLSAFIVETQIAKPSFEDLELLNKINQRNVD
jgi:hypothetical protein